MYDASCTHNKTPHKTEASLALPCQRAQQLTTSVTPLALLNNHLRSLLQPGCYILGDSKKRWVAGLAASVARGSLSTRWDSNGQIYCYKRNEAM